MNTPPDHAVLGPDSLPAMRPRRRVVPPYTRLWLLLASVFGPLLAWRAHFGLCLVMGESMLPNLRSGDLLLVNKRAYRSSAPARGDVVVARDRGELIIKRVVGLPGEEVELRRGELHIDRLPFGEDYAVEPGELSLRNGRLFDNKYALLGDNRSLPVSLAVHAVVTKDQILGRVVRSLHLWPPKAGLGSAASGETTALNLEDGSASGWAPAQPAKREPPSSPGAFQAHTLTPPPTSSFQGLPL